MQTEVELPPPAEPDEAPEKPYRRPKAGTFSYAGTGRPNPTRMEGDPEPTEELPLLPKGGSILRDPKPPKKGWALLHSKLPAEALSALPEAAYGVAGLTDVNEGYLIQRLWASELPWEEEVVSHEYLGFEDRTPKGKDYTTRWYLAHVSMYLIIDGRRFYGEGGHDNRKLDAAFKGAKTVAFKNACKDAGMTIELYKDGKAMDFIYEART